MKPADMVKMLELEEMEAAKAGSPAGDPLAASAAGEPSVPESETVLELDKWGERRGVDLTGDPEVREAAGLPPLKLLDDGTPAPRGKLSADEVYWSKALADFHAAAYEYSPEKNEACTDKLRQDFMSNLMETPDFEKIRATTVLNPVAAEIVTGSFAKQFATVREEVKRDQAQGKGKNPGANGGKGGVDQEIQVMKAAAKACATAMQDVQDCKDAAEACGLGDGSGGSKLDAKRLAAVHKRVKHSPNLKKIAELAGRFRRLAASKQRQKVTHGADEVIGVTMSGELSRVLPAELMKLNDEDLELNTLRRLIESQTLSRETRASEPAGRGPIVVTVDESGSMQGNKIETAKALALALAWIARKQKRWCALVGFSGGQKVDPKALLLLPPNAGAWNEQGVLDWLEHFFGGGTTLDVPLVELPAMWNGFVKQGMARGKTDIIMITDAEVDVPDEMARTFNAFKVAEKAKLTTIVVEGSAGNISCVSDEVFEVPALTLESDAVGRVLSV